VAPERLNQYTNTRTADCSAALTRSSNFRSFEESIINDSLLTEDSALRIPQVQCATTESVKPPKATRSHHKAIY
jgi:hypothetical protein